MATNNPTFPVFPSPLVSFAHRTFAPGEYIGSAHMQREATPFFPWNLTENLTKESAVAHAHRAAAALTILAAQLGNEAPFTLEDVVSDPDFQRDIANTGSPESVAAHMFIRQISRYLWAFGQHVSPAQ